jgi:hypothetical protein
MEDGEARNSGTTSPGVWIVTTVAGNNEESAAFLGGSHHWIRVIAATEEPWCVMDLIDSAARTQIESQATSVKVVCLNGRKLAADRQLRESCGQLLTGLRDFVVFCHVGCSNSLYWAKQILEPVDLGTALEYHGYNSIEIEKKGCFGRILAAGDASALHDALLELSDTLRSNDPKSEIPRAEHAINCGLHSLCADMSSLSEEPTLEEFTRALESLREEYDSIDRLVARLDHADEMVFGAAAGIEQKWRAEMQNIRRECEELFRALWEDPPKRAHLLLRSFGNPLRRRIEKGRKVLEEWFAHCRAAGASS